MNLGIAHMHNFIRFMIGTIFLVLMTLPSFFTSVCRAQVTTAITSDSSLGTTVNQSSTVFDITNGTRPGNGQNLFHSFGQFSVGTGDIANFLNDSGLATSNILSRVTGGDPSQIFGTVQTTNFGSANLFFMNPAGIVFGPNATLNVGGSTHFATADYLRLGDEVQFTGIPGMQDAILSVASVAAFGFLGSSPTSIMVEGSTLSVQDGQALSLVGGDISIGSGLTAPSGKIGLASVASSGEILTGTFDTSPNMNAESFTEMGSINLLDGTVDVSGNVAGTILIRSGKVILDGSRISANTTGSAEASASDGSSEVAIDIQTAGDVLLDNLSVIEANVISGSGDGGDILLNVGGNLEMRGGNPFGGPFDFSGVQTLALFGTAGHAGDIEVIANDVQITSGNIGIQSVAVPTSTGNAGNVFLTAGGLQVFGEGPTGGVITSIMVGAGQGGNVDVSVPNGNIFLSNGQITATTPQPIGSGDGGNVRVVANNLHMVNEAIVQAGTGGPGNAGSTTILLSENLDIRSGSFIGSLVGLNCTTSICGAAGDTTISAKDIAIAGFENANDPLTAPEFTGIRTRSVAEPGGNVIITADNLQIANNGVIRSASLGPEEAGDITIILNGNLELANKGQILATAEGSGDAGNISVFANNINLLPEGSSITAQSASTGNAGNINLQAVDVILLDGATVTTEASQSSGGNINLQALDLIRLNDSTISSSVQGNADTAGGNISLDPEFIILQNSQILAQAVEGQGGNISLVATNAVLVDPFSVLDASSALGVSGSVDIQAPIQNLSGTLAPLSEDTVPVAALYGARCAAGQSGHFSTFVNSKTDSLSPIPGRFLSSPLLASPQVSTNANASNHGAPVVLTASLSPLLLGEAGESLSACP